MRSEVDFVFFIHTLRNNPTAHGVRMAIKIVPYIQIFRRYNPLAHTNPLNDISFIFIIIIQIN